MTSDELAQAMLAAFRTHLLGLPGETEAGARVLNVLIDDGLVTVRFVNLSSAAVETLRVGTLEMFATGFGATTPEELAAWIQIELDEHVLAPPDDRTLVRR